MVPETVSMWARATSFVALIALASCAAIPSSGPTGAQVSSQIKADTSHLGIALVEVTTATDLPKTPSPTPLFSTDYKPPAATELIGAGDILDIAIYETGIAVFGRGAAQVAAGDGNFDPSARAERLPPSRVSDEGSINIPFVGELPVSGLTTFEVEQLIRKSLRGKSQNPQVLVSIREGLTNSIIIGGDIGRPGRLVLPTNRESLTDVIALAGGHRGEVKDMLVRVQRSGVNAEFRLSDIMEGPERDIRIFPSDRISLVRMPRSFSVMGAAGKADLLQFPGPRLSLAEAVAMAGGSSANVGDPRAVFVFRMMPGADGAAQPVVYHLNMMQASSYLLAQRFAMNDKDVLYIGNAAANQPSKLVQIISQLFFPLIALQTVL